MSHYGDIGRTRSCRESEMTGLFLKLIARDYWDRLRWWDGQRHHDKRRDTHFLPSPNYPHSGRPEIAAVITH